MAAITSGGTGHEGRCYGTVRIGQDRQHAPRYGLAPTGPGGLPGSRHANALVPAGPTGPADRRHLADRVANGADALEVGLAGEVEGTRRRRARRRLQDRA
jgi:hypothetical protein